MRRRRSPAGAGLESPANELAGHALAPGDAVHGGAKPFVLFGGQTLDIVIG